MFSDHVVDVPLPFYNMLLKFLLQKKAFVLKMNLEINA